VQTSILSPWQRDDECRSAGSGLAFELAQGGRSRLHERRAEDEILGWIANQDELREDDQIGAEFRGAISRTTHAREIAGDVAHSGIQLCERNGETQPL
jgi:hypothetical protein